MSYAHYAEITIDKDKVGETDADFAFPVVGTYDGTDGEPDLRTVANGGNIQNTATGGATGALTVPADLVFSSDDEGLSPYSFEFEFYDPATGQIIAWVRSGVSTVTDPVLYVVYGDSGVTTSQEDVPGTWDDDFLAVYHLGEVSGSTIYDSTGTYNGSAQNTPTFGATGKIGDGVGFAATSNEYIDIGDINPTAAITVEAWGNATTLGASDFRPLLAKPWTESSWDSPYIVYLLRVQYTDRAEFGIGGADSAYHTANVEGYVSEGTFYHLVGTYDGTTGILYIDSVNRATVSYSGSLADRAGNADIGKDEGAEYMQGVIDEVRISSIARSAGYVTTCHNSQSSPSTFYSMGAENDLIVAYPYGFIM